jgi:hypothetical protein
MTYNKLTSVAGTDCLRSQIYQFVKSGRRIVFRGTGCGFPRLGERRGSRGVTECELLELFRWIGSREREREREEGSTVTADNFMDWAVI